MQRTIEQQHVYDAMRTEVVHRFPEYADLTDYEVGAVYAVLDLLDAGNADAHKVALAAQRACVAYYESMERALADEQKRLEGLFK